MLKALNSVVRGAWLAARAQAGVSWQYPNSHT